ncbi:ankyrin repeat-containing domain protein [Aspergillus cavernicola]|uniref:Ankyrin repeat-containing domain protein n=1 Tax=Aspergillus cavernicola TaxID=176166 RepID=A0ABR4J1B8_9EURO
MMPGKAPRIPNTTWDKHREEITDIYLEPKSTLEWTMRLMIERHGFEASKNQYRVKLNAWKVGENVTTEHWVFIDSRVRKRKLEGKESEVSLYGQQQSREKVTKQIARNVTKRDELRISDSAATPEGIDVFTPAADALVSPQTTGPVANQPQSRFRVESEGIAQDLPANPTALLGRHFDHLSALHGSKATLSAGVSDAPRSFAINKDNTRVALLKKLIPKVVSRDELTVAINSALMFRGRSIDLGRWPTSDGDGGAVGDAYPPWTTLKVVITHTDLPRLRVHFHSGTNAGEPSPHTSCTFGQTPSRLEWLVGVSSLLDHRAASVDARLKIVCATEVTTALDWAFEANIHPILELVLEKGTGRYPLIPIRMDQLSPTCFPLRTTRDYSMIKTLLERVRDIRKTVSLHYPLVSALEACCEDIQMYRLLLDRMRVLPEPLRLEQVQKAWHYMQVAVQVLSTSTTIKVLHLLLKADANLNSRNPLSNATCLQEILRHGTDEEVPKFLLLHGAAFDTPASMFLGTPLQEAVHRRYEGIITTLLDCGADVNAAPARIGGKTALQFAAINDMIPLATKLLSLGAIVDAKSTPQGGVTAIQGAAEHGHLDMLKVLLRAYPGDKNIGAVCKNAARYAECEGHCDVAEWLREFPNPSLGLRQPL